MKKFLFLTILFPCFCFGQTLKFETTYFDAVDKWVAFDKNDTDSSYIFGFIYIDEQAGFTFDYDSRFEITENGLKKLPSVLDNSLKYRLSTNTAKVHILTDQELKQLNLPAQPEWLEHYKVNEKEISYLVHIGYQYNHVGASNNALIPLLEAYNKEPHFEGLEFELAYAYNATKNHEKAIEVLTKAIENQPKFFWYYRELGYAYCNLRNLEKAEKIYKKGISLSDDKNQKAEMAINMAQSYFNSKDKAKFNKWAKITKQYAEKGSQFDQYIEYWQKNWENE